MMKIKLDIPDIHNFLEVTNKIPNDINLVQGYSVVSGKSLMGVMSLDLRQPMTLIIRDSDDEDIWEYFKPWIHREDL